MRESAYSKIVAVPTKYGIRYVRKPESNTNSRSKFVNCYKSVSPIERMRNEILGYRRAAV